MKVRLAGREMSSTGPSFLFTFLGLSSNAVAFQIIRCVVTRGFWRDDVLFTRLYVCVFFPDHFRQSEHLLCSFDLQTLFVSARDCERCGVFVFVL